MGRSLGKDIVIYRVWGVNGWKMFFRNSSGSISPIGMKFGIYTIGEEPDRDFWNL